MRDVHSDLPLPPSGQQNDLTVTSAGEEAEGQALSHGAGRR